MVLVIAASLFILLIIYFNIVDVYEWIINKFKFKLITKYNLYYQILISGDYTHNNSFYRSSQSYVSTKSRYEVLFMSLDSIYPYIYLCDNGYIDLLLTSKYKFYQVSHRYWYHKFMKWHKTYGDIDPKSYKRDKILSELI